MWSWPLDGPGAWTIVPIEGRAPLGTSGMQSAYDPAGDRVIVLPPASELDSVPVLELAGSAPRWVRLAVAGGPPPDRSGAALVVDQARGRLLVEGGVYPSYDGSHLRDLWSLSLSGAPQWTNPIPARSDPSFATRQGLVLDPTLDRLLLIAGTGQSFTDLGDRNTLYSAPLEGLAGWTDLDPDNLSPIHGQGVAFYDAAAHRALFWNGTLWEITWTFGTPDALGAATVFADGSGVHVHWPGPLVAPYAAAIDRTLDDGQSWTRVASVAEQPDGSLDVTDAQPTGGANPIRYRAVIERGGTLRVIGTAAIDLLSAPGHGPLPRAFALAALRPNPASDQVTLELASPAEAGVSIEIFDTAGRRVGAVARRRIEAGVTGFSLPLARGLAPGLYLVRARDRAHTAQARLVVAR